MMRKGGGMQAEIADMQASESSFGGSTESVSLETPKRVRKNFVETWLWSDEYVG